MSEPVDVVLIGGGIMSATLGSLLQQLEPEWDIKVLERLDSLAQESSDAWNNAGTGHSALCELNYTPEKADGSIDITSAVKVNEQFQLSRQFWTFLVQSGRLPEPRAFITPTPHMSFVWGEKNVDYLRKRYDALCDHPLFSGMEFSDDPEIIRKWAPALIEGRQGDEPVAATYAAAGTDVDFGSLTRLLTSSLVDGGAELRTGADVRSLKRAEDGTWIVRGKQRGEKFELRSRFVFVGAGGGALTLLQKSRIAEIRGFGGFPVSGEFLRTRDPAVVGEHHAKVYGKAAVGAPPMSVPHLDTRVVNGEPSLMFGPYAGFSPRFLKNGSLFDLLKSVRLHNLVPMLQVAVRNLDLVRYLLGQLVARRSTKFAELQAFYPAAQPGDWEKIVAGQRVQVIKKDPEKGGVLQFGTEVVAAADGSIAGLLGASPGASTAVAIMLDLLEQCFPDRWATWEPTLGAMVPSNGAPLASDPQRARELMVATSQALGLDDDGGDPGDGGLRASA
ncbi:malate:quinone oxidoreductase [Nocardioides sp. CPCC 205120]|uniref:malate:quinone oxidoreductase n=1 Tax=Nocardioides sp. CPCC 205120 TaxID=3406462 RepID=UPI003B51549B